MADKAAISRVFEHPGWKIQNETGIILARSNGLGFSRLVVVVGKKKVRRAVDRNRTRRVVRACFQEQLLPVAVSAASADFVFVARQRVKETVWRSGKQNQVVVLWSKASRRICGDSHRHAASVCCDVS